jgi:hypothetical protein
MPPRAINSGSAAPPRLRCDLNVVTLLAPGPRWTGPKAGEDLASALAGAGYEGLQDHAPRRQILAAGLNMTGAARLTEPGEARAVASRHRDFGFQATTLHVGQGLEDDDEAARLAESVLEAAESCAYPLFIETHRATITQDIRRTLELVRRLPELRFNADLAHWLTGHELAYGDMAAKIAAMEPVLKRTLFLHGRISNAGAIQLSAPFAPRHLEPFRAMWTRCFAGFLARADLGDEIVFVPELPPASAMIAGRPHHFDYAKVDDDGEEIGDRWADALALCQIARECFDAAWESRG